MIRALLRLILVVVIVGAAVALFLQHRAALSAPRVGAEVGQKTAEAANFAEAVVSDGALTAKIKSKMALDDSVRARAIEVSTDGHVVTLSGIVRSRAEHDRAVQLARETAGVTRVNDHLALAR